MENIENNELNDDVLMTNDAPATRDDDDQWSGGTIFDIERLLSTVTIPENDRVFIGVNGYESTKPPKQLACTRCHAQKLRCVRKQHARICDRCLSANLECIGRQPQRMGRPVDRNSPRVRSQQQYQEDNRRDVNRIIKPCPPVARPQRKNGNSILSDNSLAIPDHTSDTAQLTTRLDEQLWRNTPRNASGTHFGTLDGNTQGNDNNNVPSPALANGYVNTTSRADILMDDLGLSDLDDFQTSVFPFGNGATTPNQYTSLNTIDTATLPSPPEDPVEQLSRLHLELYQCLTSVKAIEKSKRAKIRNDPDVDGVTIDSSWSERLFWTIGNFIDALRSYVGNDAETGDQSNNEQTTNSTKEGQDTSNDPQIDMATTLMVVSCYTRLLQIFEVVVFIVETFRVMDCPGSYVQIRFGSFIPPKNKELHARFLGQYVIHLIDSVSEAVDTAVASRQPYARAIAEVRKLEIRLKERILTSLS
ncbi:uncharacterized protein F4822DRAFT_205904 [Hypoxylon trugodes]|uniref:uncharacterized protein n=1 Tax=Hypoxylon trugodes TaxID=326681 RepID=UPI00219F821F|nr:uncharacterized protein F4822DRAFT_205904 [Hypoxylon trugodes]KAI1389604.1 hypothetical protein F4822DRAFT_205904 [Hypoxylon trugodes]